MRSGLVTTPHTHYCGYCRAQVDCTAARDGGCLFDARSPMTCNPCAELRYPLVAAAQGELFGGESEDGDG